MGMFGPSTDELIAAQQSAGNNTATNMQAARLSPAQQVNFLGAQSGNQAGSALRGVAQQAGFLKTPEMKNADKRQAIVAKVQQENPDLTGEDFYNKLAEEFDKAGMSQESMQLRGSLAKLNTDEGKAQNEQAKVAKNKALAQKALSEVAKNKKAGMPDDVARERALTTMENSDDPDERAMAGRLRENKAKQDKYKEEQYKEELIRYQDARDAQEKIAKDKSLPDSERMRAARRAAELQEKIDNVKKSKSKGGNTEITINPNKPLPQAGYREALEKEALKKVYPEFVSQQKSERDKLPNRQDTQERLAHFQKAVDDDALIGIFASKPIGKGISYLAQLMPENGYLSDARKLLVDAARRGASSQVNISARSIDMALKKMGLLGGSDSNQELATILRSIAQGNDDSATLSQFMHGLQTKLAHQNLKQARFEYISGQVKDRLVRGDSSMVKDSSVTYDDIDNPKWDKLFPDAPKTVRYGKILSMLPERKFPVLDSLKGGYWKFNKAMDNDLTKLLKREGVSNPTNAQKREKYEKFVEQRGLVKTLNFNWGGL